MRRAITSLGMPVIFWKEYGNDARGRSYNAGEFTFKNKLNSNEEVGLLGFRNDSVCLRPAVFGGSAVSAASWWS
jgi:hypothetical protein